MGNALQHWFTRHIRGQIPKSELKKMKIDANFAGKQYYEKIFDDNNINFGKHLLKKYNISINEMKSYLDYNNKYGTGVSRKVGGITDEDALYPGNIIVYLKNTHMIDNKRERKIDQEKTGWVDKNVNEPSFRYQDKLADEIKAKQEDTYRRSLAGFLFGKWKKPKNKNKTENKNKTWEDEKIYV